MSAHSLAKLGVFGGVVFAVAACATVPDGADVDQTEGALEASETICTLRFAGRRWEGRAADLETAKNNAVKTCESRWIAPHECFRAKNTSAMDCQEPPPGAWECTLRFAGRIWRAEDRDRERAKSLAVKVCEDRWIAPNECFRAKNTDAMDCIPERAGSSSSGGAADTVCTLRFAGRRWEGRARDLELAKNEAVKTCESRWIAPSECFRAKNTDAMNCQEPPPAAWECTLRFAGHIWRAEDRDQERAKDLAVQVCEGRWIAPNECFRAKNTDAMDCVPERHP